MKHMIILFSLLVALCGAMPAKAGFLAEKVDDSIFFVSYQRGQVLRGNVLFDREKKVQKRLVLKAHAFCLEEGFSYLKFPTLGEIATDDNLRAIWELGAGDESLNTSQPVGTLYAVDHVHKTRRLLLLETSPGEGFEACRVD